MKKIIFVLCMVACFSIGSCTSYQAAAPTEVQAAAKPIVTTSPAPVNGLSYAFTQAGDHPEKVLVGVIDEAKSTLDIAIYSLTHPDIVQAIAVAKKRGVTVRIISDQTEAKNKTQTLALNDLKAAGVPIKINTHSGLMHLKVTIVDNKLFTSGSFNYSKAASTTNDEVLIVDRDPLVAARWDQEFNIIWNDTKKFTDF